MELLTGPIGWMVGFVVAMFTAWLKGFFKQFLPSPHRARLALANAFKARLPLPEKRFRLVLCWLGNDSAGRDTGTVAEAFTSIDGIELIRSAPPHQPPARAADSLAISSSGQRATYVSPSRSMMAVNWRVDSMAR